MTSGDQQLELSTRTSTRPCYARNAEKSVRRLEAVVMHHEEATGRPSVNLDGWMLEKEQNLRSFHRAMAGADIAVVEGVMGLFDGHNGRSEVGSTAQMAKWLGAPVVLVLDCWALSRSAAAMIKGYEGQPILWTPLLSHHLN